MPGGRSIVYSMFVVFWPYKHNGKRFLRRRSIDSRTGPYGTNTGPEVYDTRWAFKIIKQAPCGYIIIFLTGLRNPYGFRMGSFDSLCLWVFKTRMTFARARKTSVRAPFGTHRGYVRALEIRGLKHTENPVESLYACDHVQLFIAGG